jgi:hypothetical protein
MHRDPEVTNVVGMPRDGLIVYSSEKSNCTQVVETTLERLGLLQTAKDHSPWVHDWRWNVYKPRNRVTVSEIATAKRQGCITLKFVRDPVDRFASMYTRYNKLGLKGVASGLTVDQFISRLSTENLLRYTDTRFDAHYLSQSFDGEMDDMWTEVIHVETLRSASERQRLKETYGLIFDANFTSEHWTHATKESFTSDQRERILTLYEMDTSYALS